MLKYLQAVVSKLFEVFFLMIILSGLLYNTDMERCFRYELADI